MKLIAHRGLTTGPDRDLENSPFQISKALDMGFDCEVDLWIENGDFFLGHDKPQYHSTAAFFQKNGLWIHAKNLEALHWLTDTDCNYFWHQEDNFVITSHKWIWTYPLNELTEKSICVMPEWHDPNLANLPTKCYGICSDFVEKIKNIQNSKK